MPSACRLAGDVEPTHVPAAQAFTGFAPLREVDVVEVRRVRPVDF
jgi:hypothetical protein